MTTVNLLYQNFNEDKLKQIAMDRFAQAMRSGRMIAFVGSSVTESMGYGNWDNFLGKYLGAARKQINKNDDKISNYIEDIKKLITKGKIKNIDARTIPSYAEDLMRYIDSKNEEGKSTHYNKLEHSAADMFKLNRKKLSPKYFGGAAPIVESLRDVLGIDRIVTLNYDLEFEWAWMTTPTEKAKCRLSLDRHKIFTEMIRDEQHEPIAHKHIIRTRATESLIRTRPSGNSVISDFFDRERTDRLIEFSVGSPDYEAHILHLHGRQDKPASMVISLRDYDRLYRRSGITKLPFEHAMRILFAGNPILCVGLGMSEEELNRTLQEYMADHPNKDNVTLFILWHEEDETKKALLRRNWRIKLGAHALFLSDWCDGDYRNENTEYKLLKNIDAVGKELKDRVSIGNILNINTRSLATKLSNIENNRIDLWEIADCYNMIKCKTCEEANTLKEEIKNESIYVHLLVGPQGGGKGCALSALADSLADLGTNTRTMLINCNFAYDVDAMLSALSGIAIGTPAEKMWAFGAENPGVARPQLWQDVKLEELFWKARTDPDASDPLSVPEKIVVIFNDFDRFIDRSGQPMSSELDILCRAILARCAADDESRPCEKISDSSNSDATSNSPIFHWVFAGTPRVQRYFDMINRKALPSRGNSAEHTDGRIPSGTPNYAPIAKIEPITMHRDGTRRFLETLRNKFKSERFEPTGHASALIDLEGGGSVSEARRAVLSALLSPEAFHSVGVPNPELALDMLSVMAFIGQTVEVQVLAHAPRVRRYAQEDGSGFPLNGQFCDVLTNNMRKMHALGLVHRIKNFSMKGSGSPPEFRYGLHRMIISEIRDRYGVPLGEAKLLTAFNLSLYVAQPVDSYNPEPDIHEELGQIVDFYIGAYKDDVEPNSKVGDSQKASGDKTELAPRAKAHVSPCLRAALAVMRNYYSTAALLAHDSTGRAGDADEERPGLLTEHCERIERLLHAARLTSVATASEEALIGAHPFYPDDIVWLHNERGVAKMMQGDLYEARASFDAAKRFNEEKVEFGYHGPNWLRINLNQLAVDFERGRLQGARSRMDKIDKSLKHEKLAAIVAAYGVPKSPEEESGKLRTVTSSQFTHDEILAAGICTGYRALVDFMAGRLETSRRRFQGACNILRAINEQRAYAFFSLHYSSLLVTLRERDEGQKTAEIAVAAVQASQQLDIANLGQIKEVWLSQWGKSEIPMIENLRKLLGVLEYAASADMYRVRVEARATLAWLKIKSGDYDVALEHAADAMATATRYGMSLRKISLRNLIGEILIKRGDRLSGHALIDKAIQNADRIGYQRAVEQAQDIRLREGRLIDPMMLRLQ